jgi:hypothetical protein
MPQRLQTEDFDLQLIKAGQSYITNVLRSPAGEAQGTFRHPFASDELAELFGSLGYTRKATRGAETPEARNARQIGARLFDTVIAGRIRDVYQRSVGSLTARQSGLRIRLRLTGVPELIDLPWELLFDASRGRFLLLEGHSTLVRHLPVPEQIEPLRVTLPLHILVAISNPQTQGFPSLDVEQEWTNLQQALRPLIDSKAVSLQLLKSVTQESLRDALKNDACHILHFIGHGAYEAKSETGVLVLEDEDGGPARVSAERLTTILRACRSLRLVVLNACEGGRTSPTDPFAGVAQALVQGAIPAVVAMQFPITDDAAVVFAGEFYRGIANGHSVDLALAEARAEVNISGAEGDIEWATPVLYMRGEGELFDLAATEGALPHPEPSNAGPAVEKISLAPEATLPASAPAKTSRQPRSEVKVPQVDPPQKKFPLAVAVGIGAVVALLVVALNQGGKQPSPAPVAERPTVADINAGTQPPPSPLPQDAPALVGALSSNLLLSSAWCAFSYDQSSGRSSTEKARFDPSGKVRFDLHNEDYSSNKNGKAANQNAASSASYWRVQNGELFMSTKSDSLQHVPTKLTRNSNGYPIIVINGKEYSTCN